MNKLILSGRPTRDPGISYLGDGDNQKIIAKFQMASNRIYKREGEPPADFLPIVAFGRQAKFIEQYVKKGMLIQITGPVRNNDYVNKDGQKVYGYQVIAESVEIMQSKGTEAEQPVDEDGYMQMPEGAEPPFEAAQKDEE